MSKPSDEGAMKTVPCGRESAYTLIRAPNNRGIEE